jgi:myo-inositol-1(or 4)-monophosphatase
MIPGSDLYGLTLVANGNLSAMMIASSNLKQLLPGIHLVKAAGGKVTDQNGQEVKEGCELVIASNGAIHNELLQQINFIEETL